jgi:hypothetical protein
VQYSGEFTLGRADELVNIKRSEAPGPWRVTWPLSNGSRFVASWANDTGFESLIGDGWGQRDHRNSDVGAILPYIIRRHPNGPAPTVYVTTFEQSQPGQELVQAIEQLPVPADQQANAVAVMVKTPQGNDYFVSCLEAKPLTVTTPDGPLQVEGRFAALSVRDGKVVATSLAEGKLLQLNGKTL